MREVATQIKKRQPEQKASHFYSDKTKKRRSNVPPPEQFNHHEFEKNATEKRFSRKKTSAEEVSEKRDRLNHLYGCVFDAEMKWIDIIQLILPSQTKKPRRLLLEGSRKTRQARYNKQDER